MKFGGKENVDPHFIVGYGKRVIDGKDRACKRKKESGSDKEQ